MRYLTCESCRFNPAECSLRQQISTHLKIFNASVPATTRMSSLRFTCPDRLIGFERGARVVIEEAIVRDTYGEVFEISEIEGTVMGHLDDRVQIWLESETSRGNRWIRLKPIPRTGDGSIGVRATGRRGDLRAASLAMICGARERDTGTYAPSGPLYWCPTCEEHREGWDLRGGTVIDEPIDPPTCDACGGKDLEVDLPAEAS